MPPLPLSLVALLALMGVSPPAAASMTTSVWYKTLVTQDQLAAATMSTSLQASSGILCAIVAANTPWCHLLTHEGNTCVLYDVVVDSLTAAPAEATATTCKTRHRNVCIVEGVPLPHGATLVQNCIPTTCWNHALIPIYTVSSICSAPFIQDAMGCVYLHQEAKNWCEAREHCYTLNAELAVVQASDFGLLQDFLKANAGGVEVWVGVKARKWLDGHDVPATEWTSTDPNGAEDDCVRMIEEIDQYKLADRSCSLTIRFLCMRTA